MKKQTLDPGILREEEKALDESIALNRIVKDLLDKQRKSSKYLFIALMLSLCFNVLIFCGFIWYSSQWEYTTTTETSTTQVEQDTGEGNGNNVFQTGENASYSQGGE
jgi:hypothetical protein